MFLLLSATYLSGFLSHSLFTRLRGSLSPSLSAQLIAPYKCTFQTGSKLDFVHFRDITSSDNQVLSKSEGDFDSLGFLADH